MQEDEIQFDSDSKTEMESKIEENRGYKGKIGREEIFGLQDLYLD